MRALVYRCIPLLYVIILIVKPRHGPFANCLELNTMCWFYEVTIATEDSNAHERLQHITTNVNVTTATTTMQTSAAH